MAKWIGNLDKRTPAKANAASRSSTRSFSEMIEPLESRTLFAASLTVENLDIIPGFERMIFNRVRNPNLEVPNVDKDRGTLKLTNTGNTTLRLTDAKIKGPFRVVGMLPTSISPGGSANVTVQFVAAALPKFTYNQTAGNTAGNKGGAHIGSLTFKTNDPANLTYTEGLAGWFQTDSEKNQEPGFQTMINLLMDYKTNVAPDKTVLLSEPDNKAKYYGEEVVSAYWQAADTSKNVGVRQLASFHTQGDRVPLSWFDKSNKSAKQLFVAAGEAGQTFLPHQEGKPNTKAFGTFSPGGATFGFKIQNEWSDDKLNKFQTGGGHHVRFYPVRDHFGNLLPNLYFMTMDYSEVATSQNFDFQDNVYLISNVKPAGN